MYDDLKKAWINGAVIEYRKSPESEWVELDVRKDSSDPIPAFLIDYEYRIKKS